MRSFTLLVCCLIFCLPAYSQNNDCVKSRVVCGNAAFTNDNIGGAGINDFTNPNNLAGCLGGVNAEKQSAWYIFTASTTGTIDFTITPLSPTDYDFAVYGPNVSCDALGLPIRCNFAGSNGTTGLMPPPVNIAFSPSLSVIAGQSYYLLVNNFNNNNSGFSLTWGGTAQLANPNNGNGNIIGFTSNVQCNTVQFNNISGFCNTFLSYAWTFGDGSPITAENSKPNPTHIYANLGNYTVTLTTTIIGSPVASEIGNTYTYTNPVNIVQVPPVVQITNLATRYCIDAPVVPLTANLSGGTFAIRKSQTQSFVNSTNFNPAILGVGTHDVRYTYIPPTGGTGCVAVALQTVEVAPLPTLSPIALNNAYCVTGADIPLVGTPTGGIFKINNVPATVFSPSNLGAGSFQVVYEYTNPTTNCSNSIAKTVQVQTLATVNIQLPNIREVYCIGSSAVTLQATPAGGIMKINNVTTNILNPTALGAGIYTVNYTITTSGGCTKTENRQVEIAPKPTLTWVNINDSYCAENQNIPLDALPTGGIFSVNGVPATQFNPATLGVGTHTLAYQYTNPTNNTCFNTTQKIITINPLPTLNWVGVLDAYCGNDDVVVVPQVVVREASGADVTYTLPTFVPAQVPTGKRVLTYEAIDTQTSCKKTFTKEVTIRDRFTPSFIDLQASYCQQGYSVILEALPAGGIFKINNLPTNTLNPRDFAEGDNVLVSYTLTVGECSETITQNVAITPNPYTTVEQTIRTCISQQSLLEIEALSISEAQAFEAQGITLRYEWDRSQETSRILTLSEPTEAGKHEVWVRNAAGCPLLKKVFSIQLDCEAKFFVPTAFTPNGDALNPTLKIFGEYISGLDFRIYNRWGEVVFESTDMRKVWDGTVAGKPAPAGMYVWQASFQNSLKRIERVKKQGTITLMR
jgi:gliding motility-associated-like protein